MTTPTTERSNGRSQKFAEPGTVLQADLLAVLAQKEAAFAGELAELQDLGVSLAVDARTLLLAELQGYLLDIETGEVITE